MLLLLKYSNTVCFILYLAGIIWFAALGFSDLQSKTYFSENALLPGMIILLSIRIEQSNNFCSNRPRFV